MVTQLYFGHVNVLYKREELGVDKPGDMLECGV